LTNGATLSHSIPIAAAKRSVLAGVGGRTKYAVNTKARRM